MFDLLRILSPLEEKKLSLNVKIASGASVMRSGCQNVIDFFSSKATQMRMYIRLISVFFLKKVIKTHCAMKSQN